MTVNYHGICTAQQSMHNSNPGILAIPQLYIKPDHNLYGKSETTSIATQEASHKTFSPQPRRSSHWTLESSTAYDATYKQCWGAGYTLSYSL